MPVIATLSGAQTVAAPRPGVDAAPGLAVPRVDGAQPAVAGAVRAVERGGAGRLDPRADERRAGRTAFDELRRSFGGDDRVSLSDAGRRAARGEGEAAGEGRIRRFEDLFARPPRRPAEPASRAEAAPPDAAPPTEDAEGIGDEPIEAEGAEGTETETETAEDRTARRGVDGEPLDERELQMVRELELRDAEVRAHEQAHKAVGGRYAGAISYDFQSGPDGKRYAVGGEVSIDISEVPGDPAATVRKMEIVRRAALAPAEPSGADRAVAATASQKAAQARVELADQRAEALAAAREEAQPAEESEAEGEDEGAAEAPARRSGVFIDRPEPGGGGGPSFAALRVAGG